MTRFLNLPCKRYGNGILMPQIILDTHELIGAKIRIRNAHIHSSRKEQSLVTVTYTLSSNQLMEKYSLQEKPQSAT